MSPPLWDVDDPVGLAEFAELLLEAEGVTVDADRLRSRTVALRMARRRDDRFPDPVLDTGRSQRFCLGALMEWQARQGRPVEPTVRWALARAIDLARQELRSDRQDEVDVARIVGLDLLLRTVGQAAPPPPGSVSDALRSQPAALRLERCLQAALAEGADPASIGDDLVEGLRTTTGGAYGHTTAGAVAELLLAVADVTPGERVVDAACGEGGLLLEVHRQVPGAVLLGREVDRGAWWVATVRHLLHRTGADLGAEPADSTEPGVMPAGNVVVLDPPFTAGRRRAGSGGPGRWLFPRWLGVALGALAPGDRAVVALPGRTVDRRRQEWVTVGHHVRALVIAPDRLRDDIGGDIAVWELTAEPGDGRILVADVSRDVDRRSSRKRVGTATLDDLRMDLRAWRRDGSLPARVSGQVVDLTDEGAPIPAAVGYDRAVEEERALALAGELRSLLVGGEAPLRHHATGELAKGLDRLVRRLKKAMDEAG